MAIRIRCKNCGSKIDAKDELLGQTRQCPKCKSSLLIVPTENNVAKTSNTKNDAKDEFKNTSDKSTTNVTAKSPTPPPLPPTSLQEDLFDVLSADEIPIVYDNMERLPTHDPPTKLLPNCRYFVFAHDRMIAHWEIGKGWQYHTGHGFVNARVNKDLLPSSGTFKFVEMIIEQKETGKQLTGIRTFSMSGKWALTAIGREPEEILAKIDAKAVLTKQQRQQLLVFIRQNYMPDFLQSAKEIYEFLITEFTTESDVFVV